MPANANAIDFVQVAAAERMRWRARRYAHPAAYEWAPAADDFGMPPYARRWQLDAQTGPARLAHGFRGLLDILGGWLLTVLP